MGGKCCEGSVFVSNECFSVRAKAFLNTEAEIQMESLERLPSEFLLCLWVGNYSKRKFIYLVKIMRRLQQEKSLQAYKTIHLFSLLLLFGLSFKDSSQRLLNQKTLFLLITRVHIVAFDLLLTHLSPLIFDHNIAFWSLLLCFSSQNAMKCSLKYTNTSISCVNHEYIL